MKTHASLATAAHVLVLATLVLSTACGEPHVAIGVSTSRPFVAAARMAFHEVLASAPIVGLDTVIIRESTNQAAPALRWADSLVSIPGVVAVVGHSNSQASLAAAPVYNQHKVVELSPTSSASSFARAGPFCFSLVPADDQQGHFLAANLRRMAPTGARVAVLYVNDDYGRGLHTAFLASVDSDRFPVVLDLPHLESSDLREQIAETAGALRSAHPQIVVWLARGSVLSMYLDSIRSAVSGVPIVGADAVGSGISHPASKRWVGVRYVAFVDMRASKKLRDFTDRMVHEYHQPGTNAAALTYDAVSLVVAGVRSGARTGEAMRAFLVSLGRSRPPFQGITGPISFDSEGRVERSYVMQALGPTEAR